MEQQETKKNVRIFGIASFLNDFGSDMIYPIWPLFVTSVMGANMAMLGFIDGLGDAVVSISQAISGYLSDKYKKRKIFVWLGYLFGAASRVGYAFATGWHMLLPIRVLDRAGKIRSAPRDAIVADISSDENRGKHFGYIRSMDNLGAVCGIVACILLLDLGYTALFLIAAVPSLIGALLIGTRIKEQQELNTRLFKGVSFKYFDKNFKLFLILNAVFSIGSFSYSFLLLYAKEAGFQAAAVPLLYLIFTLVAALCSLPFGKLSDRIGRKPVLFFSFLSWGLTCAGFLYLETSAGIILSFIFFGLHKAALEPVQKTLVSELAPSEIRASALGGFQMIVGLCAFPSSLFAGLLWEHIQPEAPLYCSLFLTIITLGLLFLVKEKRKAVKISS